MSREDFPKEWEPRPGQVAGGGARRQEPPEAYSITSFCKAHGISRTLYYQLQGDGLGPSEMRLRGRVLISRESAAAWRKKYSRQHGGTVTP